MPERVLDDWTGGEYLEPPVCVCWEVGVEVGVVKAVLGRAARRLALVLVGRCEGVGGGGRGEGAGGAVKLDRKAGGLAICVLRTSWIASAIVSPFRLSPGLSVGLPGQHTLARVEKVNFKSNAQLTFVRARPYACPVASKSVKIDRVLSARAARLVGREVVTRGDWLTTTVRN